MCILLCQPDNIFFCLRRLLNIPKCFGNLLVYYRLLVVLKNLWSLLLNSQLDIWRQNQSRAKPIDWYSSDVWNFWEDRTDNFQLLCLSKFADKIKAELLTNAQVYNLPAKYILDLYSETKQQYFFSVRLNFELCLLPQLK